MHRRGGGVQIRATRPSERVGLNGAVRPIGRADQFRAGVHESGALVQFPDAPWSGGVGQNGVAVPGTAS